MSRYEYKDMEATWMGKGIDGLIEYYTNSPMKEQGAHDLRHAILDWLLENNPTRKFKYFNDDTGLIDYLYLRDANQYFNKAIYTFLCYKYLQLGGYYSWARITFYYPRFYMNQSLSKLQGYSLFYGKPPIEVFRTDWDEHNYCYRRAKVKGGFHTYIWDITKLYYSKFSSKGLSIDERELRALFDDDYYKKFGIEDIRREELEDRDKMTYETLGFDELYYIPEGNFPIIMAYSDGMKNYIDSEVFKEESSVENYDGSGIEEGMMGSLIKFTMELLGQINKAIKFDHTIYLCAETFNLLKTNNDTRKQILEWAELFELPIS
jgi:hypothetical protein